MKVAVDLESCQYVYVFIFFQASERSGILNPWIWLTNGARSTGPDFPIRTPRTDSY